MLNNKTHIALISKGINRANETKIEIVGAETQTDEALEARTWRSFCFLINPDATRFFAKLLISLIVISLCSYQLVNVTDCGSQHLYSGLLGMILGAYLK
tara:strand:- start:221 stop:517 length:297 start_codon:yes stop_codon:yes gene_type:complete